MFPNPYIAVQSSCFSYTAFGSVMTGRSFSSGNGYKYGFNTQEKDDDIFVGAFTAEHWEYDSRLGRRWNIDPVVNESESGYSCLNDNPIMMSDFDGDEPEESTSKPPKLKFIYQLMRVFNPNWWGQGGKDRMKCLPFKNIYKKASSRHKINWVRTVDKTKYRTQTQQINTSVRNGTGTDIVVNTPNIGVIRIVRFDDFRQVDQLIIENASNGNGAGTDPGNNNTGNDLFTSPTAPDGDGTTPVITNTNVSTTSPLTRIRVLPNINGASTTTIYDLTIVYQWNEKKTKHREYFLGFIPMVWKNKSTGWKPTSSNSTKKSKSVKWKRK